MNTPGKYVKICVCVCGKAFFCLVTGHRVI